MSNKDDWKDWELLAYEYVKDLYKDTFIIDEQHTEDSHDSGFDGIWLLQPQKSIRFKKVLMEAKYRKSQSSLPLNDCAKSIIIAFNLSAKQLYIVTNISFAPQTKQNVIKFKKRSNLEISCISGREIKRFIQKNKKYLIEKSKIDEKFLNELETTIKIPPEIDETTTLEKKLIDEYVIVKEREEQIDEILNNLTFQSVIYLISGNVGSGKSVFCNKISEKLEQTVFDTYNIDLNLCTSSRVLYLSVLESIWGVKLQSILEDSNLNQYIDRLISVNSDDINSEITNAVKKILLASYNQYENQKDIYLHLLLKYLDLILNSAKNELKIAIFFNNLNMASEEVFVFLIDTIKILRKNNIRVILEVRTPFLLHGLDDIQKSKTYFQKLKNNIDFELNIAPFGRQNAIKLIKNHFDFNDSVCESLANVLCDNPLEIHNAIKILDGQMEEIEKQINNIPIMGLDTYWDELGITINTASVSLIQKLKSFPYFSQIYELSTILKGRIPREFLELFYAENTDNVIQIFEESTIFTFYDNTLKCKHLQYLNAMEKVCNANLQLQTARKLLPYIKKRDDADEFYQYVELNILYIINDKTNIPLKTLQIVDSLMSMHQYKNALIELFRFIKMLEKNRGSYQNGDKNVIQILLLTIVCLRELHEENNANYEFIYDLTEENIILNNANIETNKFWYEYQLMLWHKNFVAGNLENAISISIELYNSLCNVSYLFNEAQDYPGQVYNAYGLSVKMLYSGNDAKEIFNEGTTLYPNSFYAKAALLSQEGNQLLKYDPSAAIQKYQELLKLVDGKQYPYQEILHTKIDIAMSLFLSGDFKHSQTYANRSSEEALSINMLSQRGRAKNIYGCCQAAQKQYVESISTFEESIMLLKLSKSKIYLWRAQLNLATVLLAHNKDTENAKHLLQEVLDTLKNTYASKIKKDNNSVPYYGLLLVLMYLHEMGENKIIDDAKTVFAGTLVLKNFSNLLLEKNWRKFFKSKVIHYSGIVLVTG